MHTKRFELEDGTKIMVWNTSKGEVVFTMGDETGTLVQRVLTSKDAALFRDALSATLLAETHR